MRGFCPKGVLSQRGFFREGVLSQGLFVLGGFVLEGFCPTPAWDMAMQPIGINHKAANLVILSYQEDVHTPYSVE